METLRDKVVIVRIGKGPAICLRPKNIGAMKPRPTC